jgi:hypothetical protein
VTKRLSDRRGVKNRMFFPRPPRTDSRRPEEQIAARSSPYYSLLVITAIIACLLLDDLALLVALRSAVNYRVEQDFFRLATFLSCGMSAANLWIAIGDSPADGIVGESVFTWQEDGVVREPKCDALEREVSERNLLDVDDVVTSVLAGQISRHVSAYLQFPYLESLGLDAFVVKLRECNLIEQPIGTYLVGHILRTIGEMHLAVEGMAIPLFGARKLREVGRAPFQFLH